MFLRNKFMLIFWKPHHRISLIKVRFSKIKTSTGKYKRKVKLSQVPELEMDQLVGRLAGERFSWKNEEDVENNKKANKHGITAITQESKLISIMYIKDSCRISDSTLHELHMFPPNTGTLSY